MTTPLRRAAPLLFVLFAAAAARSEPAKVAAGPSFASWQQGAWEFGVDAGVMIPTQKASFSHIVDNQRAYDLLANETVGDEVAEGFIAPPLPGSSMIAGTFKPMADFGLHAYRQWTPWLQWGLEGGYGIRRDLRIDNSGIYDPRNFLKLNYSATIVHLSAPVKIGKAYGSFKPYLLAGPGVYLVQERATISFNDADDPQLKPLEIVRHDGLHPGLNAGAGVEWRVQERGLIGLDVVYHKVFSGSVHSDFLLPKLRLSVMF
jgi:opacity protein-like surface antigen